MTGNRKSLGEADHDSQAPAQERNSPSNLCASLDGVNIAFVSIWMGRNRIYLNRRYLAQIEGWYATGDISQLSRLQFTADEGDEAPSWLLQKMLAFECWGHA